MELAHGPWLWGGFAGAVLLLLALDLGVFHRRDQVIGAREALAWSGVWVALALGFGAALWLARGPDTAEEYLAGWLIEKSLSVDNLFVFVMVFGAFGIPAALQHRVLFWGIAAALLMRAGMIWGGAALLARFHWLVYVLGTFLVATGVRLWLHRRDAPSAGGGPFVRLVRRVLPSTPHLEGHGFLVRQGGRLLATPLLLALVAVELTDVVFAVDSIPAIFAVTDDPFVVFTSNVFAMLGLRSLYFLLAGMVDRFRHLKAGLSAVLIFVGVKMAAAGWVKLPPAASLGAIAAILAVAVAASLRPPRGAAAPAPGYPGESSRRAAMAAIQPTSEPQMAPRATAPSTGPTAE